MSISTTKTGRVQRTRERAPGSGVLEGAPLLPQVNLLPPEVRAARGLVHLKRWLALAVVVVVLVIGLAYVAALLSRGAADSELADAQAETVRLEQEEAKYAEVPVVVGDLRRGAEARELGMSTEILWKGYLDAVAAVLPANVRVDSFSVAQATPTTEAGLPADEVVAPGVGTITFATTVLALPDNAAWLDALNSVPGFYGATATSESLSEDEGVAGYTVTSTVQVDQTAFARRFVPAPATDTAATEGN